MRKALPVKRGGEEIVHHNVGKGLSAYPRGAYPFRQSGSDAVFRNRITTNRVVHFGNPSMSAKLAADELAAGPDAA